MQKNSPNFDCKNHEGPSDIPDYIRMDKNLNNIDIMLLDKNYKPQENIYVTVKTILLINMSVWWSKHYCCE
jgi:hypothetical protein